MCGLHPFSFSDISVHVTLCVSEEHSEYDYTHNRLQMRSVRRDEADSAIDYICSAVFHGKWEKFGLDWLPISINVLLNSFVRLFESSFLKHQHSSYHTNL